MQHLELITDYLSCVQVVRLMQKIWTEEYQRKAGFPQYILRTYGIELVMSRMDEGKVTIVSAKVLDPARYNLFVLKWGVL